MVIAGAEGTAVLCKVAPTMLLAIITDEKTVNSNDVAESGDGAVRKRVPLAELKSKLAALAEHLKGPLSAV